MCFKFKNEPIVITLAYLAGFVSRDLKTDDTGLYL